MEHRSSRAPSRSRRHRPAVVTPLVAIVLAMAGGSGAAAATVATVPLKERVGNLAVDSDGTVRIGTEPRSPKGEFTQLTVGERSLIGAPLLLQPVRRPGELRGYPTMTPDGAVVVYRTLRQPHPRVRVLQWRAGKQLGAAQTISDPRRAARPGGATSSPSGAAAVDFSQHLGGGRWADRLAIRPVGATRFLPAIAIDPDRSYRVQYSTFTVVFGVNGDGAISVSGARGPVVRRIARDGSVGPAIAVPVGDHDGRDGFDMAVGPTGEIALAWSTRDIPAGDPRTPDDRQITTRQAWAAALPVGASAVTAPRELAAVTDGNDASFEPTASVAPSGQFLLAFNGNDRIELWEGADLATLSKTASFPNAKTPYFVDGLFLFATADGGAAALWADSMMLRTPGGVWSAPERVLVGGDPNTNVEAAVPMADGGVAAVVSEWPSEDNERHYAVARIHR